MIQICSSMLQINQMFQNVAVFSHGKFNLKPENAGILSYFSNFNMKMSCLSRT